MTLLVSDLDGTLIRSAPDVPPGCVRVDDYGPARGAVCTVRTLSLLAPLCRSSSFVVATSRSVAQYTRLRLPRPEWALAANGLFLAKSGLWQSWWERSVRRAIADTSDPLPLIVKIIRSAGLLGAERRLVVRDAFVVLLPQGAPPKEVAASLDVVLGEMGWTALASGRQVYALPRTLDKAVSIQRLLGVVGVDQYAAAGDSAMDHGMLLGAVAALVPRGCEVKSMLPTALVTDSVGVEAAEEILARLSVIGGSSVVR